MREKNNSQYAYLKVRAAAPIKRVNGCIILLFRPPFSSEPARVIIPKG